MKFSLLNQNITRVYYNEIFEVTALFKYINYIQINNKCIEIEILLKHIPRH